MSLARDKNGQYVQALRPRGTRKLSYTNTSSQSAVHPDSCSIVRVCSTTDCYLAFGVSPVATNSSLYLPANTPEYFGVTPGERIAAVARAADGDLLITEA